MSKLVHISLALLLLISTVGITVDKHYCGGHFVGTWFYAADDACGMDMPADSDCCHDDITIYNIENEFHVVSNTISPKLQLIDCISFPTKEQQKTIEDLLITSFAWQADTSPPTTPKIYIKVQSFLI